MFRLEVPSWGTSVDSSDQTTFRVSSDTSIPAAAQVQGNNEAGELKKQQQKKKMKKQKPKREKANGEAPVARNATTVTAAKHKGNTDAAGMPSKASKRRGPAADVSSPPARESTEVRRKKPAVAAALPSRVARRPEMKGKHQTKRRRDPGADEAQHSSATADLRPGKKRKAMQTASQAAQQVRPQLSKHQQALATRLAGARFRSLNEALYTQGSKEAQEMFQEDRNAFFEYHDGFAEMVRAWPVHPLDLIIGYLDKACKPGACIGDFGCGEARLAADIRSDRRLTVHSFDLVAANQRVVACDIADVPLPDASLDFAVFCLSLMGTNYADFLAESRRTLRTQGQLIVAEVTSRITDDAAFVAQVVSHGFRLLSQRNPSKLFMLFVFQAVAPTQTPVTKSLLKPCIYKRR